MRAKVDILLYDGTIIPKDSTVVNTGDTLGWKPMTRTDSFHTEFDLEDTSILDNEKYFERVY